MIMTRSLNDSSRAGSPVRRGASPVRRGASPARRGASPVRRGCDDDDNSRPPSPSIPLRKSRGRLHCRCRRHPLLPSPIRLPVVGL